MRCIAVLAALMVALSACNGIGPGKVILTEDAKGRYVQLREGRAGYVLSAPGHVEKRADLDNLREVHGDLHFICREIHGVENPRLVIESKSKEHYQVVYKQRDHEALKVIAKALGLDVTQEERKISAITIRESAGGHKLKPAAKGEQANVEMNCRVVDERWALDGVTADELARFLETRLHRPVVNLTALDGRWSILLSRTASKIPPEPDEVIRLDSLGLELRWEKVKILVTVVKDKPKESGK
jgi:hypothetical protein